MWRHTFINNTELIVDFPLQRRPKGTGSKETRTEKVVTFSKYSTAIDIEYPTIQETAEKWYSQDEENHFRSLVPRDATVCSMMWMRVVENELPHELLIRCLGVDHLLSDDVPRRYMEFKTARKMHVQTVLNQQERQRARNQSSTEELAYVSEESSKWARERAHKGAKLYMMADVASESAMFMSEFPGLGWRSFGDGSVSSL